MAKQKPVVKINSKGRVILTLSRNQAQLVKPILERLIEEYKSDERVLNLNNSIDRIYADLFQDLYLKYYTDLDVIKEQYKLTLSKAQAIAWWDSAQAYPLIVEMHPLMQVVTDQLHQKLAR